MLSKWSKHCFALLTAFTCHAVLLQPSPCFTSLFFLYTSHTHPIFFNHQDNVILPTAKMQSKWSKCALHKMLSNRKKCSPNSRSALHQMLCRNALFRLEEAKGKERGEERNG